MSTVAMQLAERSGALVIGPIVIGVALVALLIGAFWRGDILKSREPAPPRPEEQPHLPPEGAVHEARENREPEEVPQDGRRRLPSEFGNLGTRPSESTERPRWSKGSSGSFGGGGLGAH
ncbi:hypothetical protein JS756_06365 [Streptomyces actuosus]|uniref:Secreted protein n=1 Tax=Streptomyces actuosus TaxID=1885 RepID=A0ABS2VKV5_STRAS|nr:DUF6479 family protein [Streptomyces actuosus]MBN0043736.1 hypothetical protein [Streptomyces actuosus]